MKYILSSKEIAEVCIKHVVEKNKLPEGLYAFQWKTEWKEDCLHVLTGAVSLNEEIEKS